MQHLSYPCTDRSLERSLPLCLCLWLAGCSSDLTPSQAASAQRDGLDAAAGVASDSTLRTQDSGVVTRGAGMPIVPIHRADAGAKPDAQAAMPATNLPAVPVGTVDAAQPPPTQELDAGSTTLPGSQPLLPQPIHRYAFTGEGSNVVDELGGDDAIVGGSALLDGAGAVTFAGVGDGVVELPDDLLDDVTSFTLLIWLQVDSERCGQRALDVSSAQPLAPNGGINGSLRPMLSSLYLTPYGCPDGLPTLGYVDANAKYDLTSQTTVRPSELVQLGASYSSRSGTLRLIVDGVVQSEQTMLVDVTPLQHARAQLGRSQLDSDPPLHGAITELRIYASKLEDSELQALFERGPDAP
jgi:hypothetical protein